MSLYEQQIRSRIKNDDDQFQSAFARMVGVVMGQKVADAMNNQRQVTKNAIDEILKYYGFRTQDIPADVRTLDEMLEYQLRPSGITRSAVRLEKGWRNTAVGPMIAVRRDTGGIVALLPAFFFGYRYYENGVLKAVTRRNEDLFEEEAILFYRPLPNGKITPRTLLRFAAGAASRADMGAIAAVTGAVTLLGLLLPALSDFMIAQVIPTGSIDLLVTTAIFFLCTAVAIPLINAVKDLLVSRVSSKADTATQAAMYMRLLNLPLSFFREHSAGELTNRMKMIGDMCAVMTDAVLGSALTAAFSLVYVAQIFTFAPALTLPTLAVLLLSGLFTAAAAVRKVRQMDLQLEYKANVAGRSFGMISGIQKIKLAGAEKRAFARWADSYVKIEDIRTRITARTDATAGTMNESVLRTGLISLVVFLILIGVVVALSGGFSRRITGPLLELREDVEHISGGDLTHQAAVRANDEIGDLARAFNNMAGSLDRYIRDLTSVTAEKERIGAELDIATHIQNSMLPRIFPAFPGRREFNIFASMDPAREVGGDFYDFFMVDDTHLAIVVADVSGKGVPAALFMVIGKTLIKDHTTPDRDLGEVFMEVNRLLCEGNSEEMFITAFEGVLDLETGQFNFVNAGHETPFICKKGGSYTPYKIRPGFVLAGMENTRYHMGTMQLEPGDRLFQYTDGVTEATNANNELYGMERLEAVLNANADASPIQLLPAVKADIDAFVGGAPQFDDITMLCLEFKERMHSSDPNEMTVEAVLDNIPAVTAFVEARLEEMDCPAKVKMQLDVAVDELFGNIAHYAYAPETGPATVRVDAEQDPPAVRVTFIDHGVPYDPLAKSDPDVTLSAEERQIGGLGILMVKKTMDDMRYEYRNGQNILTVVKRV